MDNLNIIEEYELHKIEGGNFLREAGKYLDWFSRLLPVIEFAYEFNKGFWDGYYEAAQRDSSFGGGSYRGHGTTR